VTVGRVADKQRDGTDRLCSVSAARKRVMMVALIEAVAAKCVVQELPGITQAHVIEPPKKEGSSKNYSIVTEGANLGSCKRAEQRRLCPCGCCTRGRCANLEALELIVHAPVGSQTCSRSGKSTARKTLTELWT